MTRAEAMRHVGEMVLHGAAGYGDPGSRIAESSMRQLIVWAGEYRRGGLVGTPAERTEAMRVFLRGLIELARGAPTHRSGWACDDDTSV